MTRFTRQDYLGIGLLSFVVVALAASFAVQTAVSERDRRLERQDLDPTLPIARSTVVLVDVTDSLRVVQVEAVRQRLSEMVAFEFQRGELVTVCSVGRYDDGDMRSWYRARVPDSHVNPMVQTASRRTARVDSIFARPLREALEQALQPSTANRTGLAASIRESAELEGFDRTARVRHLLVASDLLENGPELSMYRVPLDSTLTVPPGWLRKNKADLQGVEVEVLEIPRPRISASERSAIRRFWTTYFDSCGAGSVRFRRLP